MLLPLVGVFLWCYAFGKDSAIKHKHLFGLRISLQGIFSDFWERTWPFRRGKKSPNVVRMYVAIIARPKI